MGFSLANKTGDNLSPGVDVAWVVDTLRAAAIVGSHQPPGCGAILADSVVPTSLFQYLLHFCLQYNLLPSIVALPYWLCYGCYLVNLYHRVPRYLDKLIFFQRLPTCKIRAAIAFLWDYQPLNFCFYTYLSRNLHPIKISGGFFLITSGFAAVIPLVRGKTWDLCGLFLQIGLQHC